VLDAFPETGPHQDVVQLGLRSLLLVDQLACRSPPGVGWCELGEIG
jgi:hypothetical protein